jgi:Na+/proline symporter
LTFILFYFIYFVVVVVVVDGCYQLQAIMNRTGEAFVQLFVQQDQAQKTLSQTQWLVVIHLNIIVYSLSAHLRIEQFILDAAGH